jgi:sulfonate transport system substrate-binding protein
MPDLANPGLTSTAHARVRLCLIAATLVACACGQGDDSPAPAGKAADAPARVLRLGYQKIGPPFLLKSRSGPLDRRLASLNARAEWIEFGAGPALLEAMRGGSVDVGYVGETPPVFAQAGGVSFVYLATDPPAPRAEAIVVARDSPIRKLADLRGRKVALNRGSNVHYLLVRALESEHLNLGDIDLLYLAPADARSAFESGQVDAWVIWDPFLAAAELSGARTLRDGDRLVDNHFFYVARREFAEKNHDLVQALLGEYQALSQWEEAHPEESAQLLSASSHIDRAALLAAERRHAYGLQPITPEILAQQQTIADTLHALDVIPRAIRVEEAFLPDVARPGKSGAWTAQE